MPKVVIEYPYEYTPPKFLKYIPIIILVLFLLGGLLSSFYTVQPDEVAVVLRFGKYLGTYEPGLHFKLPFRIDNVYKLQITQIQTDEFGFRSSQARAYRTVYAQEEFDDESLMLTGDLNIGDVEWIVQHRIKDPKNYLFKIRDHQRTLRDISESVVQQIVGDRSIDEVLTIGRQEIEFEVTKKIQEVLDGYEMGAEIVLVKLQNVTPPKQVAPSFNEVNEARQEKERMINDALAEYNKTVPKLKGDAQQIISQAEGYAINKTNMARGDVARFCALLKEYLKAPEITKTRLYLEIMGEIYKKSGKKIVVDEEIKSILPILDLEKLGR